VPPTRRAPAEYRSPACLLHEVESTNHASDAPDVRIKRIYEEPQSVDGLRVLVDRLWPRGEALRERSRMQRLTLLYAAKEQVFNHAAVLLDTLSRR
jgi:uncharacterized protein YeaO (DUF488 family)